jgi:hypothetical protein
MEAMSSKFSQMQNFRVNGSAAQQIVKRSGSNYLNQPLKALSSAKGQR